MKWLRSNLCIELAAVFALAVVCSIARGDIDVKPQYDANEQITATVVPTDVPAGSMIRGSFSVTGAQWQLVAAPNATELRAAAIGLSKILSDVPDEAKPAIQTAIAEIGKATTGETFNIWAGAGTHVITAKGMWVKTDTGQLDGKLEDFGWYEYSKTFTVGPDGPPPPPPIVNPYKPTPAFQAAVRSVQVLSLERVDSQKLSEMYFLIAQQTRAGKYKSLGAIRSDLVKFGSPLNLKGKYSGLSSAIDKYLSTTLGLEEVVPTGNASDVLETLAWAVFEAGAKPLSQNM